MVGFDNQAIQSVAYTDPACLCIGNDRWTYAYIAIAVEERMAYAGTCFYNRYFGILAYTLRAIFVFVNIPPRRNWTSLPEYNWINLFRDRSPRITEEPGSAGEPL